MTPLDKKIAALETELTHRERALRHLGGIPRKQNETAIARLYDVLTDLNIQRLEARAAKGAN